MGVKDYRDGTDFTAKVETVESARDVLEHWAEDDPSHEADARDDLEVMRDDPDAHLTAAVTLLLLTERGVEVASLVVLPHLCRCSWCRGTLHQALALSTLSDAHPARALLEQAESWSKWAHAGRLASQTARQALAEQGVNIVYGKGDAVYEVAGDGDVKKVADIPVHRAGKT